MTARKSILVSVVADAKYSSNERLINRFIKLCKKERIREEYRERAFFKSKSEKRREKHRRALRRLAKAARLEQTKRNPQGYDPR